MWIVNDTQSSSPPKCESHAWFMQREAPTPVEWPWRRFYTANLVRCLIWFHLAMVISATILWRLWSYKELKDWHESYEKLFIVFGLTSLLVPPVLFIVVLAGRLSARWKLVLLLLSLTEWYVSMILLLPSVQ